MFSGLFIWAIVTSLFSVAYFTTNEPAQMVMGIGGVFAIYCFAAILYSIGRHDYCCVDEYLHSKGFTDDYKRYETNWLQGKE